MPPRRKKDKHLPPYVYFKHGAYYYAPPYKDDNGKWKRKWILLSRSYPEAMRKYGELGQGNFKDNTMSALFDRYLADVARIKRKKTTYESYLSQVKIMKKFFGPMIPSTVTPQDICRHMDIRAIKSVYQANKDLNVLKQTFKAAVRWGVVAQNPTRDIDKLEEPKIKKSDRFVEDWEFKVIFDLAALKNPVLGLIAEVSYWTGLRLSDVLKIKISDLSDQGIFGTAGKTDKSQIWGWANNPPLKEAVEKAKVLRGNLRGLYLFIGRNGQPYNKNGFSSMWRRLMGLAMNSQRLDDLEKELTKKARKENFDAPEVKIQPRLKERFMFKSSTRAKIATDLKNEDKAAELLQHSDKRTTKKHYIKQEDIKIVQTGK